DFTFRESLYLPYDRPVYRDLFYSSRTLKMYAGPDVHSKKTGEYAPETIFAVKKDTANWLKVDQIKVVPDKKIHYGKPKETDADYTSLKITSGWISKSQRWGPWIGQKQETPTYRFEVSGTNHPPHYGRYDQVVNAIKIINKKTRSEEHTSELRAPAENLKDVVQVQDCNF